MFTFPASDAFDKEETKMSVPTVQRGDSLSGNLQIHFLNKIKIHMGDCKPTR